MDAQDYRNALGAYPKGVTIITTYDSENEPWRLRAISFTSVYPVSYTHLRAHET